MGCFMNLLWLLLGGIFTAVEYLISSLLMMFLYTDEYSVVIFGWHLDLSVTFGFRNCSVYNHYRYSFWFAAL